jgi:tetrapyrrole methylase family protein/MazG family protein
MERTFGKMANGKILMVGLGPAREGLITSEVQRILTTEKHIYLRTEVHPSVSFFYKRNIPFKTFDWLYEKATSFEELYESLVDMLIKEAKQYGTIVYAVPGSPTTGETTVRILREKAPEHGIDLQIHESISFIEPICKALALDPINGLLILDGLSFGPQQIQTSTFNLITQVYNKAVASDVKLKLMEVYPYDFEIILIQNAGVLNCEKVIHIPLYELDRLDSIDHLTTVVVPPLKTLETQVHEDEQCNLEHDLPQDSATCNYPLDRLVEIMDKLRSPEGCPWDREQDHMTIRHNLVEETYEVLEALDNQDTCALCEELGDLLLQIVFHTQFEAEKRTFDMNNVIQGICDKLERRHPHVFGDIEVSSTADVLRNWDKIKAGEKKESSLSPSVSILDNIPKGLPALMYATKIQSKAAKVGFDWSTAEEAFQKVQEEAEELHSLFGNNTETKREELEEEIGDLLFAVVNVARLLEIDSEQALFKTIKKFYSRFNYIETEAKKENRKLEDMTLEEMDKLWNEAKSNSSK